MQENTAEAVTEESAVETQTRRPTTLAEEKAGARKILEMRQKSLSRLVEIHLQVLTQVMMSNNGVSELEKRQANKALLEAVTFALDFGVGVVKPTLRDKGQKYAQQANNLAGVLVQTFDNRLILLAENMQEQDELEKIAAQPTTEEAAEAPIFDGTKEELFNNEVNANTHGIYPTAAVTGETNV